MCRKKIVFWVLVSAFCLTSPVNAVSIIWVSGTFDDNGDGAPDDQAWVDLLEEQGYTVDYNGTYWRTLDADKIAALNAADLIIISRNSNSGDYDDDAEPTQWNSITTPIINCSTHVVRSSRWLWVDSTTIPNTTPMMEIVAAGHLVFAGVASPVQVVDETMGQTSFIDTDPGNGTVLATGDGLPWIIEWETGVEYYNGAGQFTGGPRMFFAAGTQESGGTVGRGEYNLTPEGEIIFLNAVRYMLGDTSRVKAYNPVPEDAVVYEDIWVTLGWSPGDAALSHDVYFGDNFDDVNDGLADTFQGNQTSAFFIVGFPGFPYSDGLVPGTTYYWRIDEVNDLDPNSPWKGDIWSFTIPSKKAYAPDPVDGARYVDPEAVLGWTPGLGAKLHTVYFGDNFDDVNGGVVGLPQATTTYTPGTLESDKTYYWRIDEFDGIETHKGNIWNFSTLPVIAVTDPNLTAWWMLDAGSGTTALDWSGHGNNGTLQGDPQWVAGYDGGGLALDGTGDNIYVSSAQLPTSAFTVELWFNPSFNLDPGDPRIDFLYWQTGSRPHLTFNRSGAGEIGLWPNIDGDFDGPLTATSSWDAGSWYHIAATFDGVSFRIYVNGNMEGVVSHPGTHSSASGLYIGCRSNQINYFTGTIDDVRLYDKALSQDEIQLTMRGDPALAWSPKPANGSMQYINDATPLSWSPGDNVSQHDIYFGLDKDAVAAADESDTTGIYRGRQAAASYTPAEGVEWGGGPYYWRIDEYNTDGTISKGRVWSFTIADFILVDDFESYDTGDNQIWYAWKDGLGYGLPGGDPYYPGNGTGSAVGDETTASYTEETIVHGGGKAMPFSYDNNKQGFLNYSEAQFTLTYPRDWTEQGVGVLSLWFYGEPSNAAEPMYVALNGTAAVTHQNPNAAQTAAWTQWTIDLQAFADQGVNLTNVNTLAIGFGNRNNPLAGGSGTMFFDDIRLYRNP
jgi:hypothetical protein